MIAKKKSDKSMNPVMPLKRKWEKAARDAEDTMGLSRQERLDQYLVRYVPYSGCGIRLLTSKVPVPHTENLADNYSYVKFCTQMNIGAFRGHIIVI